jgi:Domain of unknown function (DUF4918)
MNFAANILQFITQLSFPVQLPKGIEVMHPFLNASTLKVCKQFYEKYYNDNFSRRMILGINPGRFGGGVTGIPFTDPIRLQTACGIENDWVKKQELSSLYMYDMIHAFGGAEKFYQQFYVSSVSPLGFTKDDKNLNYYDDKLLQERVRPFVVDCLNKQLKFGIERDIAFCLGDGKNFQYLSDLNKKEHFFEILIPLSHPRFIMQYRLKKKEEYIQYYLQQLTSVIV